ncbi:MAG TPA: ATP-binding protein [Tahibacter sp.]|uniref:hybrid sensor histidine kinase/response regulator n=1 Tax=Tahibacter sp. TaxID=2056211 RepID=UPI002C2474CC|nr:ATP-binding protein [Tahibacter sp.]HSX59584.1 ATP-binding protein [Tahibacter sp.]
MTIRTHTSGDKDELFRLLVDRVKDYAIFGLDPAGIVVSWNTGAEHIKGYKAGEIIGHHFSRFYPEEAIRSGWPQTELAEATRLGRFEDEGWRIRKDGSRFWANVVITALFDDDGVLRGFAKVTRDLTERQRVERIEADARIMGEFVAMLAHELRNPLAPIRNAVAVVRHRHADPQTAAWAWDVIDRQSRHMSALVDDLLDVSRISRGLVRLERRRVRLKPVLDAAIETVRPSVANKQHGLDVRCDDDPVVRGDRTRLIQVFTNLLSNACKYTPAGGTITVELDSHEGQSRLRVSDTGVGIPSDLLPRIFDLFTQDKRALDRSEGGLGLGLAIAKQLVEMHHGKIAVESAGRGCGSTFTVTLPLFRGGLVGAVDTVSVLIIDDNRDAAVTLQTMLTLEGYACDVAYDGETGLERAREMLPDVILLDIGLPGMDGYAVAREIRRNPDLDGVMVAALTGYSTDSDERRAIDAGCNLHLTKPVTIEDLRRALPALEH